MHVYKAGELAVLFNIFHSVTKNAYSKYIVTEVYYKMKCIPKVKLWPAA